MSRKVKVTLKSGKTIEVLNSEVKVLQDAGLLAKKADNTKVANEVEKELAELKANDSTKVIGTASVGNIPKKKEKKKKGKTKEEKLKGIITKGNIK